MRGNDARQRCRVWPEQQPLQGQGRSDAVGQGRRFMLEAEQQEGLLGGAVAGALGGRGRGGDQARVPAAGAAVPSRPVPAVVTG
jgi:hypothetical protein